MTTDHGNGQPSDLPEPDLSSPFGGGEPLVGEIVLYEEPVAETDDHEDIIEADEIFDAGGTPLGELDRLAELKKMYHANKAALGEAPPAVRPQLTREMRATLVEIEELKKSAPDADEGTPFDEVFQQWGPKKKTA